MMGEYKRETKHAAAYALSMIDMEELEKIYAETKAIYETRPESTWEEVFTPEYRAHFESIMNDEYFAIRETLVKCRQSTELTNIAFTFFDETNNRLVFVVDGDRDEWMYYPGQWLGEGNGEVTSYKGILAISNSNWGMDITHGELSGWTAADYIPLTDTRGNQIGYFTIDIKIGDMFRLLSLYLLLFVPMLFLLITLISWLTAKYIRSTMTKPLKMRICSAR